MAYVITPEIVVAYSQCPWKAFLLIRSEDKGTPHEYIRLLEDEAFHNRINYLNNLKKEQAPDYIRIGEDVLTDVTLKFDDLMIDRSILYKSNQSTSLGKFNYTPTIIVGTHQVTKEQKLELLFSGYVLGKMQKQLPPFGTIMGADGQAHKIGLDTADQTLKPILGSLREWAKEKPSKPPQIILNKNCSQCQFRIRCLGQAEKDDNLSLLDRITAKKIQQYQKKGIFTVTQLSYLFKPRRRRKHGKKIPVSFKLELQALAIRTGKIYIQDIPELPRQEVELFLDLEGIPDQNFHYLIGLVISEKGNRTYHFFWANTHEDEQEIWNKALAKINEYPEAPVYHYGSYEPRAIAVMTQKYHTDIDVFKNRLINLNACIYGKLYFPSRSNSLKDLGKLFGASWTAPDASGLQSLVWRHLWEKTKKREYQEKLVTYNQEDCQALWLLAEELSKIITITDAHVDIDFADSPKQRASKLGNEIHDEFNSILRYAHADYNNNKVSIRPQQTSPEANRIMKGGVIGHQAYLRIAPSKADTVIRVMPKRTCPKHKGASLEITKDIAEKFIINMRFTKTGCKKTVTKYLGKLGYCQKCRKHYPPPKFKKLGIQTFGHAFQAWVIYQRIVLHLPYRVILQDMEDIFNESMSEGTLTNFVSYFAEFYSYTEKLAIQRILESPFVHVDETLINIQGVDHYVWVFTNGTHVVFRITETRESTIVHDLLNNYKGVLISDFYGGYDAVTCRQQKCLVHLIRDLNNDLWENPYNQEYEAFVSEVKQLLVPIFEAEKKFGLTKQHFNKFRKYVDLFYRKNIDILPSNCELLAKYQKRFQRYRDSLFTFLVSDGIPWHNNTAENAIRHLAVQRKISGTFFKKAVPKYLLLLGIAQTCRFQGKSFLKFLLSEEIEIDKFKATKHIKKSFMVGSSPEKPKVAVPDMRQIDK